MRVSLLAVRRQVSASTQNQALSALLFLYRDVLAIPIGDVSSVVRARTPERLPVVLSRDEVGAILKQLTGTARLFVMLLYGTGLRLEECLDLRVKDIDFDRHQIIVRQGKGRKDRVTMLPVAARDADWSSAGWSTAFAAGGLRHIRSTVGGSLEVRRGPRAYGVLIASRYPLGDKPGISLSVPWEEKALSVLVVTPVGELALHNVHVPPGSSNGWVKVEVLEAVYAGLSEQTRRRHTVLCGDFNTPQCEFGFRDVFRSLHGYQVDACSWMLRRKGLVRGRRFDHVFASERVEPVSCIYLDAWREAGLSDHAAIETVFEMSAV